MEPGECRSLTPQQRVLLTRWSAADGSLAQRATIVLLAADGVPSRQIAARLGVSRPTVSSWCQRFDREGIVGLQDRPRSGRPRSVEEADVVLRTLLLPAGAPTSPARWSSRLMAGEFGISPGTVAGIWRRWQVRPDDLSKFRLATSPALGADVHDVVGFLRAGSDQVLIVRRPHVDAVATLPRGRAASALLRLAAQPAGLEFRDSSGSRAQRLSALLHGVAGQAIGGRGGRLALVCGTTATGAHPLVQRFLVARPSVRVYVADGDVEWPDLATVLFGLADQEAFRSAPSAFVGEVLALLRGNGGRPVCWTAPFPVATQLSARAPWRPASAYGSAP